MNGATTPKLCIHCQHYVPGDLFKGTEYAPSRCKRPANGINLVDGSQITDRCSNARSNADLCGAEGRYFEPALPAGTPAASGVDGLPHRAQGG